MSEFEDKIRLFIGEQNLFDDCGRLLVAVSGGVDSMVLLDVLAELKQVDLVVAHINHNLRGNRSDTDEMFVKDTCRRLGIEVLTDSVDVKSYAGENKLSTETAARILRQTALRKFIRSAKCDAVATGHHADDNAETVIHRLLRGTGYRGLAGINPKRTIDGITFISPMLCANRNEIAEYAEQKNIAWRQDHTNEDIQFTRNRIRHKLIPLLQKESRSNIIGGIDLLSERCRALNSVVSEHADSVELSRKTLDSVQIESDLLKQQPKPVQIEIVRRALQQAGCGLGNIRQQHYEDIIGLSLGSGGRRIELPNSFVAEKQMNAISINPKSEYRNSKQILNSNIQKLETLPIGKQLEFDNLIIQTQIFNISECNLERFTLEKDEFIERFDADKISGEITVRYRAEGDRFVPLGSDNNQKVGKFITAAKTEYHLRNSILIFSDSDKIVWVCPVRAGEQTKITAMTKKIIQISVRRKTE